MVDRTLVIVDAANVVGSVPDGWWHDREAATRRLRDALSRLALDGFDAGSDADSDLPSGPAEIAMVVEGAARGVTGTDTVRVVAAAGSGDDAIVELVRVEAVTRRCVVITADRELRERVTALGARVAGPRTVRPAPARPAEPDAG